MKRLVLIMLISTLSIFSTNNIYAQYKKQGNEKTLSADNSKKGANNGLTKQDDKQSNRAKAGKKATEKYVNELKQELKLDEKQTAEVRILLGNHFAKAAAIKAKKDGDENFIENLQLKAARMDFHRNLKNILDKKQRQRLKDFREKKKEERTAALNR